MALPPFLPVQHPVCQLHLQPVIETALSLTDLSFSSDLFESSFRAADPGEAGGDSQHTRRDRTNHALLHDFSTSGKTMRAFCPQKDRAAGRSVRFRLRRGQNRWSKPSWGHTMHTSCIQSVPNEQSNLLCSQRANYFAPNTSGMPALHTKIRVIRLLRSKRLDARIRKSRPLSASGTTGRRDQRNDERRRKRHRTQIAAAEASFAHFQCFFTPLPLRNSKRDGSKHTESNSDRKCNCIDVHITVEEEVSRGNRNRSFCFRLSGFHREPLQFDGKGPDQFQCLPASL